MERTMKVIHEILENLPAEPIPVRKLVIGVHWILVASKYCGLGSTLVGAGPHGHGNIRDVGELHRKSAQDLARWILSDNLLEASIGMAALNSLLEIDEANVREINAAEVIAERTRDKNLAVVGHFPFVDRMKTIAQNCWVIEKRPYGDDFPEDASDIYIPQADVVAITGTAFINHSMEHLLAICRKDATVMILGPSTPLSATLFNYGVTYLSGSRVMDEDAALLTIQQGAAFPQVRGVRLLTMMNPAQS